MTLKWYAVGGGVVGLVGAVGAAVGTGAALDVDGARSSVLATTDGAGSVRVGEGTVALVLR